MNTTHEELRVLKAELWVSVNLEVTKKVTIHELQIAKDAADAALDAFNKMLDRTNGIKKDKYKVIYRDSEIGTSQEFPFDSYTDARAFYFRAAEILEFPETLGVDVLCHEKKPIQLEFILPKND